MKPADILQRFPLLNTLRCVAMGLSPALLIPTAQMELEEAVPSMSSIHKAETAKVTSGTFFRSFPQ